MKTTTNIKPFTNVTSRAYDYTEGKKCVDCGELITNGSTRCKPCNNAWMNPQKRYPKTKKARGAMFANNHSPMLWEPLSESMRHKMGVKGVGCDHWGSAECGKLEQCPTEFPGWCLGPTNEWFERDKKGKWRKVTPPPEWGCARCIEPCRCRRGE